MYYLEDLCKGKPEAAREAGRAELPDSKKKMRIHLLGLGDVGGSLLTGLKLLGGDILSEIGICSSGAAAQRYEYEMNQIAYPGVYDLLPEVKIIQRADLFNCDVFVFCASKSVPAVGAEITDVRMIQYEANREIIQEYAVMARNKNFKGLFAVVSDPVDPLCKAAWLASNRNEGGIPDGKGLRPGQIKGYGLGVMNSRAAYYAKCCPKFRTFLEEGRAFGPHGKDLVIADSLVHYNDVLSKELTRMTVEANLKVREIGFKPYIAPAISSGAISILMTLRGEWHYSSFWLGGVFFGAKNRLTRDGTEYEKIPLPELLYQRIEHAYRELEQIL